MSKILIPSSGPEDWRSFIAKPDLHWKTGYSARTLAHSWEAANGLPPEVAHLMSAAFGQPQLLFAVPEHKTMLPGGTRESQSDILALVRHKGGLATYTVEGKVEEASGETVARLSYLCASLGLRECPPDVRYQLLHRTVSALIEAERFDAPLAGMIVHSFSPERRWFDYFSRFVCLLGVSAMPPGEVIVIDTPSGRPLALCWACGDATFLKA